MMPMTHQHALLAGGFDVLHRDPFDRMLAAQALVEDAVLVSSDPVMASFGASILW